MLTLPLGFYRSYIVEHRFGLSRETLTHWFADELKESLIGVIIFLILIEGFFFFLRNQPHNWWWISGLFWIFFSIVLARLFPILIIPLFFKYKRISDEELRQRILNLAAKMGIKILDVYQIDFSTYYNGCVWRGIFNVLHDIAGRTNCIGQGHNLLGTFGVYDDFGFWKFLSHFQDMFDLKAGMD